MKTVGHCPRSNVTFRAEGCRFCFTTHFLNPIPSQEICGNSIPSGGLVEQSTKTNKTKEKRERRREKTVLRYAKKRAKLKELIRNPNSTDEERTEAQIKLQKLPRDANPIRLQRRCNLTGRPHAVYKKFGLGRNKLRELAMKGDIPGLVKSSW